MTSKLLPAFALALSMCAAVFAVAPNPAQTPATKARVPAKPPVKAGYAVPRTPDGKPDFQGYWSNATVTPLERPQGVGEFLTKEQMAAAEKRGNRDAEADEDGDRTNQSQEAQDALKQARATPRPGGGEATGNYNAIWWQLGKKALDNQRSSIIVGPTGRLPHTPETVKKLADNREFARLHPADGPEFRDNIERCIAWIGSGPPMLPTFYNNTYQIYQTPEYVAILVEMIHDVRIIPLDGRPHLNENVRQWTGDARGHWEGDTLVVETTNINSKRNFIGGGGGRSGLGATNDRMRVVERFTRTDKDTILYQFTVENPAIYSQPWSGEIPMKATTEPLYEYACHEGNYALVDIISGARADEKKAAAKAK